MSERVALKVKITRKNGTNVYPDFNQLGFDILQSSDWTACIDGWHYDAVSGFGQVDAVNPDPDVLYGVICVCPKFADASLARFPDLVTELNDAEFEAFHDTRATTDVADRLDVSVLQGLMIRYGIAPVIPLADWDTSTWSQADRDRVDPNHESLGVRAGRTYQRLKATSGFTIRKV